MTKLFAAKPFVSSQAWLCSECKARVSSRIVTTFWNSVLHCFLVWPQLRNAGQTKPFIGPSCLYCPALSRWLFKQYLNSVRLTSIQTKNVPHQPSFGNTEKQRITDTYSPEILWLLIYLLHQFRKKQRKSNLQLAFSRTKPNITDVTAVNLC